jgi:hypothetical protein
MLGRIDYCGVTVSRRGVLGQRQPMQGQRHISSYTKRVMSWPDALDTKGLTNTSKDNDSSAQLARTPSKGIHRWSHNLNFSLDHYLHATRDVSQHTANMALARTALTNCKQHKQPEPR